jgi:MATE family multidrug resistance protein
MFSAPFRAELRTQISLMLPVLLAQLAQMTLGVVDTVMTGRYSNEDMAAVALAWSIWLPAYLFGIGLIVAVTPCVGQLRGAVHDTSAETRDIIRQGVWLAMLVTVPISALMYFLSLHLE